MSTVLLIVDENEADRNALAASIADAANVIHTAATPADAMEITSNLAGVSAMIVAIPDSAGNSVFEFRDHLVRKFSAHVPTVFCSRSDMSAYYSKVEDRDKLFFKPIEIPVLKQWLTETIGPPVASATPQPDPNLAAAAAPAAASGPPPTPGGIDTYEEDLPVGTQLGDYRLERIIQRDKDFALYEAEQTSINRKVAIKTLYRKHRRDPVWVQAFVNEASARAKVNHPNVSLVYECIQETGVNFYTLELVDAPSLADLAAKRADISDDVLWGILESCSSALEYFRNNQMQHRIITPQTILLQNGDQTRIANPVKNIGKLLTPDEENQQMQYLSSALKPFTQKGTTDPGLYSLIDRLGVDRIDGIKTIDGLRRGLSADADKKQNKNSTAGVSEDRIAEIKERETNKKAIIFGGLIGAGLVLGGIIAALVFFQKPPLAKEFNEFAKIPSGPFPYQDGDMVEMSEFWMAKQEVSIGQYANFLQWCKDKPTSLKAIQHPDQPADKKDHEPSKWNAMYEAARKGKKFMSYAKIDLNYPISGVDWWDAFAYARYQNARLPTEQEWEKAARGRAGLIYPWGNELNTASFNSGVDQNDKEGQKAGTVDGFQFWSAVDDLNDDMSRYGVTGMAGNVSEWTDTWDSHPDSPDKMVPIKRGASFGTQSGFESSIRRAAEMAEEKNFYTGFRIVSDVEPGSDPNYKPAAPKRISGASASPPSTGGGGNTKAPDMSNKTPPPPPEPAMKWDPADGQDPFTTIFATPSE